MATEFGKIASLTQNMEAAESPLTRELNRLTKQVTVFAMCMGIAFFLLSMFVVKRAVLRARSSLRSAWSSPLFLRGLLPTVTLSLAMAVQRMSTRNAPRQEARLRRGARLHQRYLHRQDGHAHAKRDDREPLVDRNARIRDQRPSATSRKAPSRLRGAAGAPLTTPTLELLLEGGLLCGNARLAAPETEGRPLGGLRRPDGGVPHRLRSERRYRPRRARKTHAAYQGAPL